MTTQADEHRNKAREDIDSAIKNLSEIIVDKVWGWDDYKKDYLQELKEVFVELIKIREKI